MVNQQTVLSLIRAALDGIPAELPVDFQPDELLNFAKSQQIEALLIAGLRQSNIAIDKPTRNKLLAAAMTSTKQLTLANQLFDSFSTHKIDHMPLKGCVMKPLYPNDALRSMGDIDVLIRTEQYDRIRPLMLAEGFTEGVVSDHEYVWDKNGIHVELHKRLIPSYNKDYFAYYGDGWQLAKPTDVPYRYEMSHEDTFIYIFTHYAKHYRDAGAGIRQVLDLYVYRKAYQDMDEKYIQQTLTQLQLERFYTNTMLMLDVWFGSAEHTEASQLISDRLFASGVFGTHENSLKSTMLKQVNEQGSLGKAKAHNWLNRIFLPLDKMKGMYPILEKCPIYCRSCGLFAGLISFCISAIALGSILPRTTR